MKKSSVASLILATVYTASVALAAQTAPDISLPSGDAVRGKSVFESSKANCLSCHRVSGKGSQFGPDLSSIAAPPRGGGAGRGPATAPAPAPTAAGAARGGGATPAFGGDEAANARIGAAAPPLPAAAATPPRGGAAGGNAPAGPTVPQLAQSIIDPNAVVTVQNRYVQLTMKDGKKISGKLLSVDTFYYQIFDSSEKLANISKDAVRDMTMASPMPSYRDKLTSQELADVISYLMSLKGP